MKDYEFGITDYPVSLAIWHWAVNGTATPISGDRK